MEKYSLSNVIVKIFIPTKCNFVIFFFNEDLGISENVINLPMSTTFFWNEKDISPIGMSIIEVTTLPTEYIC